MSKQANKPGIGAWIQAFRLRTLPLALASVFTGAAIADEANAENGTALALIILTTVLLQILSNLANDYGDSVHGADNAGRVGPARAVQSGAISISAMKKGVLTTALLAFISGLALLYVSLFASGRMLEGLTFLGLGLLAIAAAVKYTAGSNPYGYQGLGDASVLLFFGWIGVAGTAYLLGSRFTFELLLPATAIGSFAAAVLNLNNLRDHLNDAASGKRTLVVKMGFEKAKGYHLGLFLLGWTNLLVWLIAFNEVSWRWLTLVPVVVHIVHLRKVFRTHDPALLDPELKKIALSTFVIAIILFITSTL